jgi:crotonobetainyl-CoA:carnitine CoA-transferase CaiB-like acyl-CoA transferase
VKVTIPVPSHRLFKATSGLLSLHQRDKKSVTLDTKSERGKKVLWRQVDVSDGLVDNFRLAAMEQLRFGLSCRG